MIDPRRKANGKKDEINGNIAAAHVIDEAGGAQSEALSDTGVNVGGIFDLQHDIEIAAVGDKAVCAGFR
jgi:hypothetical protein